MQWYRRTYEVVVVRRSGPHSSLCTLGKCDSRCPFGRAASSAPTYYLTQVLQPCSGHMRKARPASNTKTRDTALGTWPGTRRVGTSRRVGETTYDNNAPSFLFGLYFLNYHEKVRRSVGDVISRCLTPSLFTLRASLFDPIRPVDTICRRIGLHFYMSMRGVILTSEKHKTNVNKATKRV